MGERTRFGRIRTLVGRKPLQTGKLVVILLSLVLGVGGFLGAMDATVLLGDRPLGDGQLLSLILLPILSLGLVVIVFAETLLTGYRLLRSSDSLRSHLAKPAGYVLVRVAETTVAVVGVIVIFSAVPTLFAASTPAPAGVGIMLLLLAVAVGILSTSLVRSTAELFVYSRVG